MAATGEALRSRRPLSAVLLDVGGLLLLPSHGTVRQALNPLGLHPDVRRLDAAHYLALAESERVEGQRVGFAVGPYWVAYARAAGVAAARCQLAGSAIQAVQAQRTLFTRAAPGCRAGLRAIAHIGAPIVLVSNTEHGHVEAALGQLGICQVGPGRGVPLRAVVDSHIVGVAKPDAGIFRLALERAGGEAASAVHVGDSLRADVQGAFGAGIAAIHFDPLGLCQHHDHPHAASLPEVAALLRHGLGAQRTPAWPRMLSADRSPAGRASLRAADPDL